MQPSSAQRLLLPLSLLLVLVSVPALPADDDMPHGDEFFEDCSMCHSDEAWSPASVSEDFDHAEYSGFRLEGVHATVDCRACHVSLVFEEADATCASCHKDPHLGELGVDCAMCHTPRSFIERGRFVRQHNETRFPLVGSHLAAECQSCHVPEPQGALQWVGLPVECEACHLPDYQTAANPDHELLGFPVDCRECHTPVAWDGAFFDHSGTAFPLTGAHRSADCSACHVDGVYEGTPTDCYACHQRDYERADDPDHVAAGFPTDCTECHNTSDWDDADFDHGDTDFPLTGAHRGEDCTSCHVNGVYDGTPTDCYACHQDDYEGTDDPDHVAGGFPTDCTECHNTGTWDDADFDHSNSDFPLTGAHLSLECSSCHGDGVYDGKPTDCYACHEDDYNGTNDPSHVDAGFSTDCTECHTTATWIGADFDHQGTDFPLTGAHIGLNCNACHGDGVYDGKPTDCYACHEDDYNATDDPDHQAANFPTECTDCHTTATWYGAEFDHDPWFPIYSGKHSGRWDSCNDCHTQPGNYSSFSCLGCHPHSDQDKTDRDHEGVSGYSYESQACYSCHPDGRE